MRTIQGIYVYNNHFKICCTCHLVSRLSPFKLSRLWVHVIMLISASELGRGTGFSLPHSTAILVSQWLPDGAIVCCRLWDVSIQYIPASEWSSEFIPPFKLLSGFQYQIILWPYCVVHSHVDIPMARLYCVHLMLIFLCLCMLLSLISVCQVILSMYKLQMPPRITFTAVLGSLAGTGL